MTRALGLGLVMARLGWSLWLMARPDAILEATGDRPTATSVGVARVLAVRHLLQSLYLLRFRGRVASRLGAGADTAHSLSMVALALGDRRWRRAAGLDAAIAAGLAIGTKKLSR